MDHSKVVAVALLSCLAFGCATARWTVQKALRQPGERLETFPELVWQEYDCANQKRPFFIVEENELIPPRVAAGSNFNHRLVYVMCPKSSTEVVSGELQTRIRYRGSPIVRQTDRRYELKPGRWTVDAFVDLPEEAEAGIYAFEVQFRSDSVRFERSLTFVVKAD